jgi:hypothetical protein
MSVPRAEPVDVRATEPGACALAFAIPTTIEGFARDLGLGRAKDFAHHASHRPRALAAGRRAFVAHNLYRRQAEVISETIDAVGREGVNVQTVLNPAGLRPLLEQYDVVTVITHWRPASFFPDDFLNPSVLAAKLRGATDPLSVALWSHLSEASRQRLLRAGDASWENDEPRQTLADEFNRFLTSRHLEGVAALWDGATDGFLAYERREALDRAYPGALFPGNRAEFDDGLHTIEDVVAQVPADYTGILDLTICNSIFLGEEIRRRCPRCGMIATVEDPTTLSFRLRLYKHAIKVLACGGRNYLDVCLALREGLASCRLFSREPWWSRFLGLARRTSRRVSWCSSSEARTLRRWSLLTPK